MKPDLQAANADLRNRLERASFTITMLQGELATYKVDREDLRKQVAALREALTEIGTAYQQVERIAHDMLMNHTKRELELGKAKLRLTLLLEHAQPATRDTGSGEGKKEG